MNKSAVAMEKVNKTINKNIILKDVSLYVEKGQVCGVIGRNGSGKSMLFKAICGLITIDSGTIKRFGEDLYAKKTYLLGALIEQPGFLPQYSGFRNLQLLASINNIADKKNIHNLMRKFDLDPLDKRPYYKYSLGMKQRLGIIGAIMEDPDLVILDEPTNNLDVDAVKLVQNILIDLKKGDNTTIMIASHNEEDISILCDVVYTIEKGELFKA